MFWLVMVTRNSGSAMATTAAGSHAGATSANVGASRAPARWENEPDTAMTTSAARSAPGTAHRLATRISTSQTRITGAMAAGDRLSARKGSMHKVSSTPASMALASDGGMAETARPNGRSSPQSTMSAPHSANAVTAAPKPRAGTEDPANSAAPGVDQAIVIGIRRRQENRTDPVPMVRHSISKPDAAWSVVAPTARSPASTTANELVKPTTAVTIPAMTAGPMPTWR